MVLIERLRALGYTPRWYEREALWLFGGAAVSLLLSLALPVPGIPKPAVQMLLWVIFASVGVGLMVREHRLRGVHLRARHDGGFYKRNRDTLLVNLIVAVVSVVLTLAASQFPGTAPHASSARLGPPRPTRPTSVRDSTA